MSKSMVLIALTLASTSASAFFWHELRAERKVSQQLETRLAQLEQASRATPVAPAPQIETSPAAIPQPHIEAERPVAATTEAKTPPPARAVFQTLPANSLVMNRVADPERSNAINSAVSCKIPSIAN